MAYYQSGYCYKRYRKPSKRKKWIVLIAVLASVIGVLTYFHCNVADMLYSLSEAAVHAAATEAVNDAAMQTLQWNGVDYNKLVTITRGEKDNILSIEANAQGINLLARQTVALSMANLNAACEEGVKVPIGVFTGMEILAGFGPEVTFKIVPVGNVTCELVSDFVSAGINQTVHSIYMNLTATVSVIMPSGTKKIVSPAQVLVCESIIVGEIPETYLHGDLFARRGT